MHEKYAFLHCSYAAPVRVSVKSTVVVFVAARGDTVVALRAVLVVVVVRGDTVCATDAARAVVALRDVVVVVRGTAVLRAGAASRDVVRCAVRSVVVIRCATGAVVAEFVRFFALPSRTAASDAAMHIMQQHTKARIFFISG